MIRQAQTYLVGAVSGTTLIVAAVVAFVMLVSLQALRTGRSRGCLAAAIPTAPWRRREPSARGARARAPRRRSRGRVASAKGSERGAGTDRRPASARVGADSLGRRCERPGSTSPAPPRAAGGARRRTPASAASSPAERRRGGGGGAPSSPAAVGRVAVGTAAARTPRPSETVTGTVNETVSGVDEATGGALGETGVTKVTEEVVDGVAGPESAVGKTVDKTVEKAKETVGGLLGGGH